MCLIAYVPQGTMIPNRIFNHAHEVNGDGLGVMSAEDGVRKFFGRRALKKARRYSHELSDRNVTHAVHWRWATHGTISADNCHPFTTPNGNAHIMHNGILAAKAMLATAAASDTALYVADLVDAPLTVDATTPSDYWGRVQSDIGWSNKFVVLSGTTFYLLNEDAGHWQGGVWYSNTYSLPYEFGGDADECATQTQDWNNTDGEGGKWDYGTWAQGKRFNVVSMKWEWPTPKTYEPEDFSAKWRDYLDSAFPLDNGGYKQ